MKTVNNITRSLGLGWKMKKSGGNEKYSCNVPCSVYKTLIENNVIPDPYYRENEYISTAVCEDDYEFEKRFELDEDDINNAYNIFLKFECIDTIAEIYLNNVKIGTANNMHREWEYSVKDKLVIGENLLVVKIKSPNKYIRQKDKERHLWGVDSTMEGYTHIRKAHCMFGWDWGPKLPDMGILRDVTLTFCKCARIKNIKYSQVHENGKVTLKCDVCFQIRSDENNTGIQLEVKSPNGEVFRTDVKEGHGEIVIDDPQLWWVNGYGGQPLYKCTVKLCTESGEVIDSDFQKIGLRTLGISQDKDKWGEEFCFINNGVKIFAMGANYIPEDQIISRCSEERTHKLLDDCKKANFNFIRVWGGGYYPEDYFYNWCDENGIIVWQDFMFACSAYLLTDEFKDTVIKEIEDNVIRLRNHPSLGLWCGNNEIESAWEYWGLPEDKEAQRDYLILFEEIIPDILKKYDPDTFYWPSSPSSGGGFKDASSNHAGDMHYWDVWHNFKPVEEFKKFYYRFCSEYGFESLPDMKTIKAFADENKGDFDLCGPVMSAHQKCVLGNEKIMFYLAQTVNYPYDFERLVYCSQIVQAECIRSNVEHMRRARGRCMGSAYWQVNDSNPVISWSSIDYFGRWKGLHYLAKRFYTPLLVSCDTDNDEIKINISNETMNDIDCELVCRVRNNKAEILFEKSENVHADKLSANDVMFMDKKKIFENTYDKRTKYLEYYIVCDNKVLSRGTSMLVRPKDFEFLRCNIKTEIYQTENGFDIVLTSDNFAKSVELYFDDADCVFSDNWFDINGNSAVRISVDNKDINKKFTAKEFKDKLKMHCYNNK